MTKYVAFLDILGFKNKLESLDQNQAQKFISNFSRTVYNIFNSYSYCSEYNGKKIYGYIVSDSIILNTNNSSQESLEELISMINKICREEFIQNGILIRGAIAKGEFDRMPALELSNLSKELIVGQAYVDAYLLEGKVKTMGISLREDVYNDMANLCRCDISENIFNEKVNGETIYVMRYLTLDLLLEEESLHKYIKFAKDAKWIPHYYNGIYFAMKSVKKSVKNDIKIEQVFDKILKIISEGESKEVWSDIDLFIENTFSDGVIKEYKTRFLKYLRGKIF